VWGEYEGELSKDEGGHDDRVVAQDLCVVGECLGRAVDAIAYDRAIGREHWLVHHVAATETNARGTKTRRIGLWRCVCPRSRRGWMEVASFGKKNVTQVGCHVQLFVNLTFF
jgi:hypothetical protein